MSAAEPSLFSQWPGGISSPGPLAGPPSPGNPGSNPYAHYGQSPPPRRSFTWVWILLAGAGAVVALCFGCGGVMYLGFNRNVAIMQEDLRTKLDADPAAQQRLGKIAKVELDFLASLEASEGQSEKRMVFHVEGAKASGDVVGYLEGEEGRETVYECQLRMPDGEEVDLSF